VRPRVALATILASLVAAPAASAQGPTIQAVDGTPADQYNNRWSPSVVTINPGETVTWSFAGTSGFHNVQSEGSNWNPPFRNGNADRQLPPASYTFSTEGTYTFVCEVHATTMRGTVTVGSPPPPPPPPLSEQHWANDQQPPAVLDSGTWDETRPRLSGVRASAVRNGARVRFRLSERSRVLVTLRLAGLTVKTARATLRAGRRTLTVRDPRLRGRYRVVVVARDMAGNVSRAKDDRVTIRQ
jgi:plastocyanin